MKHRTNKTPLLYLTSALLLSFMNNAFAERYALLVGISDYHVKPLSGPINDVNSMKSVLNKKWSFKNKNIRLLLNKAGTKNNILNSIKRLNDTTKAGDDIFIYLSGHGTSARDRDFSSPLPTTSGAFIPIDIQNVKNKSELINRLIIGRNDLKPILQKFDQQGKNVFVAIDACYSGNTVRGVYKKRKLDTRYLSINDILQTRGFGDDLSNLESTSNWQSAETSNTNAYPYKNIYYLSASGEYEPAQDIQPNMLDRYPTIDGKPHGAFTDTLLRVLNNKKSADIDHNGIVTYSELKKSVRNKMRLRGFDHTPQGLPSLAEDKGKLASRGIFGHNIKVNKTSTNSKTKKPVFNKLTVVQKPRPLIKINSKTKSKKIVLRVAIDNSLKDIKKIARKINNVKIVSTKIQLEVRKKGEEILFISQAGDLILRLYRPSTQKVIDKIKHQVWIKQLVEQPFRQDFNIDLDMFASGRGSTVVEGEAIGVAIKSTQAAHILIININPHGIVNVLYPYTLSETKKLAAYQLLAFKELSRVIPPFGREYLQVYAFKNSSQLYLDLMAKSFNVSSTHANKLKRLLQNKQSLKARASLEVVTTQGN